MKILHISNYFPPDIGGIEDVAKNIVTSLPEHENVVLCFSHGKKDIVEEQGKIKIYRAKTNLKVASQALSLSFKKYLKKVMKEFDPEIVIFHFPNPFQTHYLKKYYKKKFKLIVYYHLDITKQKILGKFFVGQTNKLLKRAVRICATSPIYQKESKFLSQNSEKCVVIPNCINNFKFVIDDYVTKKVEQIKNTNKNKTICFAIGRHVEYKGLEYLIRASKYLNDNYKIYIGGKGPLTNKLKEIAQDDSKIEFLGRIEDKDLVSYYQACDIFCFPSITKNEAFGVALAEAMYFNNPAVTFNIPGSGVNYVSLDNITGIEVPNRDIEKYADAIRRLGEDSELRKQFAQNAHNRVKELFLYDKFKSSIRSLIGELDG